jgi:hypothetical protein
LGSVLGEFRDRFFAALTAAGMPKVPEEFSVAPFAHIVPHATVAEIDAFIGVFDRVSTRPAWQRIVTADAPPIARSKRPEVCFFTAWDFHLSPDLGWHLIECNDNGSGFLFAGLINRIFYELSDSRQRKTLEPPPHVSVITERIAAMVSQEAEMFFGSLPDGMFLILDDAESLEKGRFRQELLLLCDLFRVRGWQSAVGTADQMQWDGKHLLWNGQEVSFIVTRSTDFFWQADVFAALRAAYQVGAVYVAPNPFTYATRSDKRLLEFLSLPDWDTDLGILPEERVVLSAHVPPTYRLGENNIEEIARKKEEFVFKPFHGFAGRGVLTSGELGRSRLRRLVKKAGGYVAQKKIPKPLLRGKNVPEDLALWTDLRVWAYRGQRFLLSSRASRRSDTLDLNPPGGWLPTFVAC